MTNSFSAELQTIALLYKHRWKIEIFFKWIKQNLQIKKFYGTSLNAVETQIWIAISTYLLVVIAKKRLRLEKPTYQILHILSFSIIKIIGLFQLVNKCGLRNCAKNNELQNNQLNLFEKKRDASAIEQVAGSPTKYSRIPRIKLPKNRNQKTKN